MDLDLIYHANKSKWVRCETSLSNNLYAWRIKWFLLPFVNELIAVQTYKCNREKVHILIYGFECSLTVFAWQLCSKVLSIVVWLHKQTLNLFSPFSFVSIFEAFIIDYVLSSLILSSLKTCFPHFCFPLYFIFFYYALFLRCACVSFLLSEWCSYKITQS